MLNTSEAAIEEKRDRWKVAVFTATPNAGYSLMETWLDDKLLKLI